MNGVHKMVMVWCLGLSLAGCGAANQAPRPGAARAVDRRGATLAPASASREVVTGPGVLHVYSPRNGTAIVVVPDEGGNTCGTVDRGDAPAQPIRADKRLTVELEAGEVACVAGGSRRTNELFWHTHPDLPARRTVTSGGGD